jgi:hypothetical protein
MGATPDDGRTSFSTEAVPRGRPLPYGGSMGLRHVLIILGALGAIVALCALLAVASYQGITHI